MATQAEITANWIAYQEAMGLGGRTPTQEERQTAITNYFETNPDATPDAIAKAATDFGVSAEEIAQATGYTDTSKIQSGLDTYQSTGGTGQTVADYTGGGSNQRADIDIPDQPESVDDFSNSNAPLTQSNINDIYRSVLGRDVGTEGLEYFLGSDTQVKTAADLTKALQDSPEYGSVTAVRQWFEENPNASIQDIAGAMDEYGVGAKLVEQATGRPAEEVTALYQTVTGGLPTQAVFGAATSEDPDIRREVLTNQYRDLFGRDPGPEAEYWISGEGKNTPLTSTALLNAAQEADITAYNERVTAGEVTPKYYNDPQLNLMANAYAQGNIDKVNELIQAGKYTYEDIQAAFGITDAGMQELRSSGVKEFKPTLKYYVLADGSLGSTYGDLPEGASEISVNEYNRLVKLAGTPTFYQNADGTVGIVYGNAPIPAGATKISEAAYNNLVNKSTTGSAVVDRTDTSGNIVAGTPQVGEVNVMDYMGLQAAAPVFPQDTQLYTQIEELDAEAVGTELGDISTADKTKLDTETDAILSSEIEKVGSMVEGTYTVPGQVTIPSSEGITTDLVSETEFTEAGVPSEFIDPVTGKLKTDENLATMTAKKSYTDINDEATAFTAAKQELAEVDPLATVTGQLAILQKQFDDGNVPVWAQGAFRQVNALMAQRGIGGSTMAAEAITNALMQSAIPIAQQDASFYQNVTLQNLSNEQEVEMAKFNARTASIFNDQAAVNAARNLNTQSENELTQFFAQLATNVSVTNAEMSNAMEQFNATAENQMTQFFEELELTAETFNADAINELAQFDAEQANIIAQFNSSMKDQRERFNVQNQLAIDASNVNWRRDVNTANTSANNAALQFDAQNLLGIQQTALNNIWQHYDTMLNFVFQSEESGKDRAQQLLIATMTEEMRAAATQAAADTNLISDAFNAAAVFAGTKSGSSALEKWFGLGK